MIMGFADRGEDGHFLGHVMDPEPVDIRSDGLLQVRPRTQAAE